MHGIKITQQDFALKMPGELMREGGAYLRDTTVLVMWQTCSVAIATTIPIAMCKIKQYQ